MKTRTILPELDRHNFGLPVPVVLGSMQIEAIDFSARDLFPLGSMDLNGWRVVGACRLRRPFNATCVVYGALARRIDRSAYAVLLPRGLIADVESVIPLPQAETLDWLTKLRAGHHGGAGRCQGNRAPDCSYPKQCSLKLPAPIVAGFTRLGGGQFSLGLRSHSAVAAALLRRHEGDPDSVVTSEAMLDRVPTSKLKAYLDPVSVATFQSMGGGAVARGIRVAYALLVHSGEIKPVVSRASLSTRKGVASRSIRPGKGVVGAISGAADRKGVAREAAERPPVGTGSMDAFSNTLADAGDHPGTSDLDDAGTITAGSGDR